MKTRGIEVIKPIVRVKIQIKIAIQIKNGFSRKKGGHVFAEIDSQFKK